MVNGINGINSLNYRSPFDLKPNENIRLSSNEFEDSDEAIISAQAKLCYELEKYNSGQGDEIDLAVTSITTEHQVEANINVINTKKRMIDTILGLEI